jgi:hypothetical protein
MELATSGVFFKTVCLAGSGSQYVKTPMPIAAISEIISHLYCAILSNMTMLD